MGPFYSKEDLPQYCFAIYSKWGKPHKERAVIPKGAGEIIKSSFLFLFYIVVVFDVVNFFKWISTCILIPHHTYSTENFGNRGLPFFEFSHILNKDNEIVWRGDWVYIVLLLW